VIAFPAHLSSARIAIVRMSAIGDVVEALPVVHSLRAALPDAHLTWIIQEVPHALVAPVAPVDEYLLFDRRAGWRGFHELRRQIGGRRWDLVLTLQVAVKAGLATSLLTAPRKVGFDRDRSSDLHGFFVGERIAPRRRAHRQDEYLEFVDHLGIPPVLEWGLGSTPAERERYEPLLRSSDRPTVALVLAASGPERNWPAERYAALAARLQERGVRVLLVGGRSPVEDAVAAAVLGANPASLDLRAWDLRRLAYLLERSDAVVSPDTGPLHVAVALGRPTVGLMGYTNPLRAGPYRFRELTVDAFGDPGERYDALARYRPGRMERIGVSDVLAKVERALEGAPYPGMGPPEAG
jgi:heptosyltransferase I